MRNTMRKVLTGDRFIVEYRIKATSYEEARQIAFSIQVEQTVEFPYDWLPNQWFKDEVTGRLESLAEVETGSFVARISYLSSLTAGEATQFLNIVFGNSSLQPGIWVQDILLNEELIEVFKGPRFGVEGIRARLGVEKRPLLQAVVKPIGLSASELASMCKSYANARVDVVKDDHGITNQCFAPFSERVKRCVEAIHEGRAKSGGNTIYAVNVSADGKETIERAYEAKELGADAIMVAPGLVGYGVLHALARDENLKMPIISHPSFAGGHIMPGSSGVDFPVWFGTLPRFFGADMPIFVTYGGRFSVSKETCRTVVERCLESSLPMKTCVPSPGGGVTEARISELVEAFGNDSMYLVGGDMFHRGPNLEENAAAFIRLLESMVIE